MGFIPFIRASATGEGSRGQLLRSCLLLQRMRPGGPQTAAAVAAAAAAQLHWLTSVDGLESLLSL